MNRLRSIRTACGIITVRELAKILANHNCKVSESQIIDFELCTKQLDTEVLKTLAKIFNVTLEYIAGAEAITDNEKVLSRIIEYQNKFIVNNRR